jgi:MFS family permease
VSRQNSPIAPHRLDRAVLLVAVAAATLGLGMITALLADLQDTFGFDDWGLGVITGSSFITSFVAYVWFSKYADRGHARLMLVGGGLITAGAMIWIAHATELWQFVAARSFVGLGQGLFVPAARRVAISFRPDEPGRELGLVFSASVGGFLFGPILGSWLATSVSLGAPFYVAAVTLLASLPFVGRLRTSPEVSDEQVTLGQLLRIRWVLTGMVLGASEFFVIGALEATWARYMTDLGASTLFIGVSFTVLLLPLVVMAPVGGRLADRHDSRKVGMVALTFVIPLTALYGQVTTPVAMASVGGVHAIFSGIIGPAAATTVAIGSPAGAIARGQGVLEAFGFLSAAVAAFAAGALYGAIGPAQLYALVAAGLVVYLLAAWWLTRSAPADGTRSGAVTTPQSTG